MENIEFQIEGMSCGGCSKGVSGRLKAVEGVKSAEVSHITKLAKVEFDENCISKEDIFKLIRDQGYIPTFIGG